MTSVPAPSSAPRSVLWLPWPVTLILVVIILPELILMAADADIFGTRRWRQQAYTYGAFWTGLLGDWTPNYRVQPFAMFFSYSFLHAGLGHLIGNAVALGWLGQIACKHLTPRHMIGLYAGSTLGGALGFAALASSISPMVGASGAIFGLAGAWMIWGWQDQPDKRTGWIYSGRMVGLIIGLNGAIWILQDGQLAWETHMGGFIAGAALAWALPRQA